MLPTFVYAALGAVLVLAALLLGVFRRGRALLWSSLPAIAFFLLLFAAAEVAFRVGRAQGGGAAGASSAVYTCSMHPQVRQDGPGLCPICHMELVPLATAGADQGTGITIDPVVVQNMGVRVRAVTNGPLDRTVRAFGAVRAQEPRLRDVALKFDGWVDRLFADTEGMALRRGDPLFAIYAPELIVAQEELIAARRSGDDGLLQSARQKLRLWDIQELELDRLQQLEQADRTLTFASPIDGVLLRRDVVQGAAAGRGMVLLRIADLGELWVDAQVPESQLTGLHPGQPATVTFDALPGRRQDGEVIFIAPTLDERARTAAVRVRVANPDGALRPGMFARLAVPVRLSDDAILAPLEAVLDTGVRQLAWVAVGLGKFEPRPVRTGAVGDDGQVQVLEGLERGELVVTSGQFLIDAESRLREGVQKFDDDGLMPDGDLPPRDPLPVSAATQQQTDALFAAYLAVQQQLARDEYDPATWRALRAAATALSTAVEPELQVSAGEVLEAVREPPPADIVDARVAFKLVSSAAVRLFELARPAAQARPDGETRLIVQHCPMAEADWLQATAPVRNPYYGSSMLECGAPRRELPLRTPEGGR
ncbi:MAG: efflux RND transporter periplasmic adaptor subunit [Planctomycetota bacterium]